MTNKTVYIVANKRNNKVVKVYDDFEKLFLSKDYIKCGKGKYTLIKTERI